MDYAYVVRLRKPRSKKARNRPTALRRALARGALSASRSSRRAASGVRSSVDNHNHLDYPPLWRLMEYRIVRSKTLEGLEEDVNAAMAEGWIATGGAMNQPFGFAGYFQAMVRD